MVVPPRSQRCLKHSEHKQRSSGARRPMQRIDPRSVSPGIKPQRQTWLASSRAESGRADYPMCGNGLEIAVLGDSALGASAYESRSWGIWGLADAWVNKGRGWVGTAALPAHPGGLRREGEPGWEVEGFNART